MTELRDHLQMALKSSDFFANDGKLKARELGQILAIAERDGVIDQNDISVLRNIISKIDLSEVDEDMRRKLNEISNKINS